MCFGLRGTLQPRQLQWQRQQQQRQQLERRMRDSHNYSHVDCLHVALALP